MKEHNMKRTIALLATLLLSFGLTYAADYEMDIGITVGGTTYDPSDPMDNIWAGQAATFDFYYKNIDTLGGYSTGFTIWTTDGATWTYDTAILRIDWISGTMPPEFDTTWAPITTVPGSRQEPVGTVWDQSFDLNLADTNGAPRDTVKNHGLYPGALERQALVHLRTGGVSVGEVKTICIDSCKVGLAGDFIFVDIAGGTLVPVTLWPDGGRCYKVEILPNMPPEFDQACPIDGGNIDHCVGSASKFLSATDAESDTPRWRIDSHNGTGNAVVDPLSGASTTMTYTMGTGDVGNTVTIKVEVYDDFNTTGNFCDLSFTFTNNPPVADCGVFTNPIGKGKEVVKSDITATDADACDGSLSWSVVSGPGHFVGDVYHWQTAEGDTLGSPHAVTVEVTDGYDTDQCDFEVDVLAVEPFEVIIEVEDGSGAKAPGDGVLQGHFADVDIILNKGTLTFAGFDFLIAYDATALNFIEANKGDLLIACEWEYFTFRYGPFGNCGNQCPSGMLRIVALAEQNDGPHQPICFSQPVPVTLATMTFLVTNDRTYECQFVDIRWFWMDCGDNTISSETGDTLFVEQNVFDRFGVPFVPPTGYDMLPGIYGIPDSCLTFYQQYPGKYPPERFIDFWHGGIQIICADSIDARGDINMNGLAYEIADAVMLTNYFIEGLTAFRDHVEGSIAASDVNADGISLSVSDLVYLVRVIIGDALPYPKPLPGSIMNIAAQVVKGELVVNYDAAYNAGAALLVFDVNGTVGTPVVGVDMDINYGFDGSELRVLVYDIGSRAIPAGKDVLLTIPVEGTANLVSAEVADYNGAPMEVSTHNLPTTFDLVQNYPNPFNPFTTIALNLPVASDWTISVYNVAGQLVKTYSGSSEAGTVEVVWDATDAQGATVASGIYFYKATANHFTATKKMLLMK
jgi:hypothetical protein